ncbi:MAG TPA: hypothetical protein VFX84_02965 [Candidatus Saccharimonadales bacterium]|nr:hypothetical protein [Candidatus Saccharimonadales bacterium]
MPTTEALQEPNPTADPRTEQVEQWLGPLSEGDRAIVDAVSAIPSENHPHTNRTRFREENGTEIRLFRSKDVGPGNVPISPEEDGVLTDTVEVTIADPYGTEQSAWAQIHASATASPKDKIFAGIEGPSAEDRISVAGDVVSRGPGERQEDHEAAETVKLTIAQKIDEARKRAYPMREIDKDLAHDAALAEKPHMDAIREANIEAGRPSSAPVAQVTRNGRYIEGERDKAIVESAQLADQAAAHVLEAAGVEFKRSKH